jgi:3-dehydroquinate dehydratase-1
MKIGKLKLGKRPLIAGVVTSEEDLKEELVSPADLLELRIDMFEKLDIPFVLDMVLKARSFDKPLLGTVRASNEGGIKEIGDPIRAEIINELIPHVDAIDLEIASSELISRFKPIIEDKRKLLIGSYHNFNETPEDRVLEEIYSRAKELHSDIVKIATKTNTEEDLLRLMELTFRHRKEGIITVSMGDSLASIGRLLLCVSGSLITYGTLTKGSAPGQMSVTILRRFFDKIKEKGLSKKIW